MTLAVIPLTFLAYHATPGIGKVLSVARAAPISASASSSFDQLIARGAVADAAALLGQEQVEPTREQTIALLDAACDFDPSGDGTAAYGVQDADASVKLKQERLQLVYDALAAKGVLRGYGCVRSMALLPAAQREVSTEDQLRLTGLPTSAFAPPSSNSRSDLIAGGVSALALSAFSAQFDLDLRAVVGTVGAGLLADRLLLRGAVAETATRAIKPGYSRTVREHEAGHFLVAFLLGCPIEACLLDPWKAARDGRIVSGAAGTVFFDPELGRSMESGTLTREILDRYSVVVMAGIAAEAAQNGRAEGGQSDEAALIQLLGGLDGGKTWDLPRVRNQARWAASQALLLLSEHGPAYKALVEALERGEGVGSCVLAIEEGLDAAFGRNGELPTQTRARELASKQQQQQQASNAGAVVSNVVAPTRTAASLEQRQREISERLATIKERLAREEATWVER